MTRLIEQTSTIEVPRGAGLEGCIKALRDIWRLSLVRRIVFEKGRIEYVRSVQPDDPFVPLKVDFDTVMPHTIIRNGEVRELEVPAENTAYAIAHMFRRASLDRLVPVAFVGSSQSVIWEWHHRTTGIELPVTTELYGFPFLDDPHIEDATLFLCTSTERDAALIDTQRSYKILMPERRREVPR
jgi:hypothetical protein